MISAVVLTKNEEKNIQKCIESIRQLADEIIVIDDDSKDETIKIAKELGAIIYNLPLNNDFSKSRNFGLEKAKGDWIIFIDADEIVSKELAEEIKHFIDIDSGFPLQGKRRNDKERVNGFFLKRKDFLFGKWLKYGETGNIKLLRLARKNSGRWERKVHETWDVETCYSMSLQNPLYHYPHQTMTEFLEELNYYSTLNAEVFNKEGIKVKWWQIILYPVGKFIKNYFLKLGFFDGTPGFIHAMLMSFHSFLTRSKLWQLQHAK